MTGAQPAQPAPEAPQPGRRKDKKRKAPVVPVEEAAPVVETGVPVGIEVDP